MCYDYALLFFCCFFSFLFLFYFSFFSQLLIRSFEFERLFCFIFHSVSFFERGREEKEEFSMDLGRVFF